MRGQRFRVDNGFLRADSKGPCALGLSLQSMSQGGISFGVEAWAFGGRKTCRQRELGVACRPALNPTACPWVVSISHLLEACQDMIPGALALWGSCDLASDSSDHV